VNLFDAHNHLQDERFGGRQPELVDACVATGVRRMVVNGSIEADWPEVLALAQRYPQVIPSFGLHPWHLGKRTPEWLDHLGRWLDRWPAAVGEIGLDRWKDGLPYDEQETVFLAQLRLAAERDLPVSIHCLRAWGRMLELLATQPRPTRGFLLHSYGGSAELVAPLTRLGAYFSFPGCFASPAKARQQQVFRSVPPDRLLIGTDAPDQPLPEALVRFRFEAAPRPLNHPANLGAIYAFLAEMLGEPLDRLAAQVESNFERLFGRLGGEG